jgi:hypothetical protein
MADTRNWKFETRKRALPLGGKKFRISIFRSPNRHSTLGNRQSCSTRRGFADECQGSLDGFAAEKHDPRAWGLAPEVAGEAPANARAGPEDTASANDGDGAPLPAQSSQ